MSPAAAKIKELETELVKLREQEAVFENMTDEQRIAITLHDMLCIYNHTDGCGWHYEIGHGHREGLHDWRGSAHAPYLTKAIKLTHFCQANGLHANKAIEMLRLIKGQ
jgi:hypothetical protein